MNPRRMSNSSASISPPRASKSPKPAQTRCSASSGCAARSRRESCDGGAAARLVRKERIGRVGKGAPLRRAHHLAFAVRDAEMFRWARQRVVHSHDPLALPTLRARHDSNQGNAVAEWAERQGRLRQSIASRWPSTIWSSDILEATALRILKYLSRLRTG